MSQATKQVARRYYDVVNTRDPNRLDQVCAADLQGHAGAGATRDELKASWGAFLEAFPDLRTTVRYLVAEDDLVSSWVTYEGTHNGTFAGVPASGRRIKAAGWDLLRIRDGQIVELTQYCDLFTVMNQIGALPTAAPA